MKICLVTEYYYPTLGGITEHVFHFARQCLLKGHDVSILTSFAGELPESARIPGLKIHRVGRSFPIWSNESFARVTLAPRLGRQVRKYLECESFDIVHIHAALTPTLPLLAAKYNTGVTVGTFHSYFDSSFYMRIFRKQLQEALNGYDGLISVSLSSIKAMEKYVHFSSVLVPNGIDIDRFSGGSPLSQFSNGRPNIFFLGRLDPRNGLDTLITSYAILRRRGIDARLIVAGDGPFARHFQSLVPREFRKDVCFQGRISSERADYFASSQIFCYPATKASFGITLLEAMAAGVPVVASKINGFEEVVRDGVHGILVKPGDTKGFADVFELLLKSPLRRKALIEAGKVQAKEFAWGRISQNILDYYTSLLRSQRTIVRAS